MTRDEYVNSLKHAFVTIGSKAFMGYLVSQFPILLNPIAYELMNHFIVQGFDKLADETEMAVFFIYTDVRVNQQGNDFIKAAYQNQLVQKTGTPEEKQNAENNLFDAFAAFASLTS